MEGSSSRALVPLGLPLSHSCCRFQLYFLLSRYLASSPNCCSWGGAGPVSISVLIPLRLNILPITVGRAQSLSVYISPPIPPHVI